MYKKNVLNYWVFANAKMLAGLPEINDIPAIPPITPIFSNKLIIILVIL